MFVGPGGIGKSSLLHGLMNKRLPVAESTQLADTMTVKPATKTWASAGADSTSSWQEVKDEDETMEIVGLVHLVARASAGHSTSSRFISLLDPTTSESSHTDDKSVDVTYYGHSQGTLKHDHRNIVKVQQKVVNDILTQAVEVAKENPNAEAPEKDVLIIIWDCGGQPIFLDILPAFLTRRTMFLLFYDARRSLIDPCIIRTFHGGRLVDEKQHKATTLELMLEWMSSIHSMLGSTESGETVPKFPRIIPVGTHGDDPQVKDKKDDIIHQLNSECKGKAFVHLLKESVIVDNTTAGQGEQEDPGFSYIRREAHEFAGNDLSIRTPIAWVLFRRVFKKVVTESNSPIVFYEVVKNIAVECGIPSTAVSSAIKFYHDLAVFFHYSEVPSLQNCVIADPQWLICQFAKILALEGFEEFHNELLWKPLRENGVLVQPLYEEVWKHSKLPSQSLVDLLVHFLLAAPIKEIKVMNLPGKEYFVSLVLPAYTYAGSQDDSQTAGVAKKAAPLHLLFNTYYVPPGFFSRLVTTLLSKPNFQVAFSKGVYCDRIIFLYGQIDEITLMKCKNSIEIRVLRTQRRPQWYMPFSLACRNILTIISECFPDILHWLRGIELQYAFVCEHCPKEIDSDLQHYIRISLNHTVYTPLRCETTLKYAHLTPSHHEWLKFCEDTQCTPDIRRSEFEEVGKIIQSEGKAEELAETLEMTRTLKDLAGDPNQAHELLLAWSTEMIQKQYAPNRYLRSHLAHHLRTIGMDSIAYKLSRNRPLIGASLKLAGAPTAVGASQSQIASLTLEDVLDSKSNSVSKHLGEIADSVREWEGAVAENLELTSADVSNIITKYPRKLNLQMREALQKWKEKLGSHATYGKLASAFIKAGHNDYADKIYEIIGAMVDSHMQPTELQKPISERKSIGSVQQEMSVQTNNQATNLSVSDAQGQSSIPTTVQANPDLSPVKEIQELSVQTNSQVTDSSVSNSPAQSSMRSIGVQTNLSVLQQKLGPTLKLLHRELYKVADKWEDIGIQLDIDVDMLEKVKSENREDSKTCLREMLKILAKEEDIQPSWSDIVEALECLEEEELAQQLRDKYNC